VRVYGIDLGTTYSCIAYVDDVGRPSVVRLDDSDTMASVVYFERPDHVVVGESAKEALRDNPALVQSLIKRDMGKAGVTHEFWGRAYTPEEISAEILKKVAAEASATANEPVRDVVITVPAYFGIAEREATKKAGELAGLNVIEILSEPVAAAISYESLKEGADRTILVFDLGGGTFDTTVITMRDGNITVVCTDGDHDLGGADWDSELADYLISEFRKQHPDASDPAEDPETAAAVLLDAERTKRNLTGALTQRPKVIHDARTATVEVSREKFEELTASLLNRALDITARTLETARSKGVTSYDEVLLVGGSTKMPAVKQRLTAEFGFDPKLFDPDLAVAKGAALFAFEETYRQLLAQGGAAAAQATQMAAQAGISESDQQAMAKRVVRTVASRSFGVIVFDTDRKREYADHLVHANDALPASKTEQYYTLEDNQTTVRVRVVEQAGAIESDEPGDNEEIIAGEIAIPRGKPRGWPVHVTFDMDRSGMLHVTAVERETSKTLELHVQTR
jgi:molecular chaperone DnaK (HSP70)